MKVTFLFFAFLIMSSVVQAQINYTVKGKIQDTAKLPMSGVQITLMSQSDTLTKSSNTKGEFTFPAVLNYNFTLLINHDGFQFYKKSYSNPSGETYTLPNIILQPVKELKTATVTAKQAISIKGDTISFTADSFNVKGDMASEELLKRLPGMSVDKDGNVTAQGKQVTKVRVNGKDFFGGDVKTATKEIPVELIDKVQVIDDYGEQANFTGVKDGDPEKVLNYVLKKDKNQGVFGNLSAGYGTDDRYAGSATVHRFKEDRQLSVMLNANNTNQGLFNFSRPGGGGGSMMRMMGGGGRSGSSDAGSMNQMGQIMNSGDFGFVQSSNSSNDGISQTQSFGINYRTDLGKKVQFYGSYVGTAKNTNTITETAQQNIFENYSTLNNQNQNDTVKGMNHRVYTNFEIKPDSNNYIKIQPQFSLRNTNTYSHYDFAIQNDTIGLANDGLTRYTNTAQSPYYAGNILWNHKFQKRGRTFSAEFNANYTQTNEDANTDNHATLYSPSLDTINTRLNQKALSDNHTTSYSAKLSYTEPINSKTNVEFNYRYGNDAIVNDKGVYILDSAGQNFVYNDSLSNYLQNDYVTHRLGVNYRVNETKYNYSLGMAIQPANIITNSESKYEYNNSVFNYFPVARFNYKFSRNKSLEANYNGRTNQPTLTQLQPVSDLSNRQFITTGNPNLQPEFNSTIRLRYNNFDMKKGNVLFVSLNYSFTNQKIVNNTINKGLGVQETQYLNANGYKTLSANFTFSKPFKERKYTLRFNGNYNYNRNISFIDSQINLGDNVVLAQGINIDIRPKPWMDLSIGSNYNYNFNQYSLGALSASATQNIVLSSDATFFLPKNFRLNYSLNKNFNSGFSGSVIANPFIINAYAEKRFLKNEKASIRLNAYDLLNQNTNISRTINANSIVDSRNNRLTRYFMLSFIYKISKFTGNAPEMKRPERPPFEMRDR